jgi:hypothetical protein
MSDDHRPRHTHWTITSIFDEILAGCPTHIRDEALLPFHQIQKYLILADYNRLFDGIKICLRSNEFNGSLSRFATHICLFLFEQNHSNEFNIETFIDILTIYVNHLIDLEFKDLVCYYISKLPSIHQCTISSAIVFESIKLYCTFVLATIMATFLDTLVNRQDKEFYLKQGFTYKIDIDQSLLILAANQQSNQPFDHDDQQDLIDITTKHLTDVSH